ncbi:hypothetical protein PG995_004078 [Apiospora arundinis]
MPPSSSSSSQTSSSKVSMSQTSRIETVQLTNRGGRQYPTEPQDSDTPEFVREGSYYETGVDDQPEYKYLQASDVRRQVQKAPSRPKSVGPHREFPIVPSPKPGEPGRKWKGKSEPGPVRAFYNENDRTQFDVGYHDKTRAPLGPQNGRKHQNTPFSLATYHPAPVNIDTANVKKNKTSK